MSRRYGRNQKRRARQEIATARSEAENLRVALSMEQGLTRHYAQIVDELRDEIKRAKAMLPRYSALLKPEHLPLSLRRGDSIRLQFEQPLDFRNCASIAFEATPLDVLISKVEFNEMARMMHVRVEFCGGEWGYAATRQAVAAMPKREFIQRVSEELARQMFSDMDKKGAFRG